MATHQESQDKQKPKGSESVSQKKQIVMVKKIAKLRQAKRSRIKLPPKVAMAEKLDDLELGLVFPKIEM